MAHRGHIRSVRWVWCDHEASESHARGLGFEAERSSPNEVQVGVLQDAALAFENLLEEGDKIAGFADGLPWHQPDRRLELQSSTRPLVASWEFMNDIEPRRCSGAR